MGLKPLKAGMSEFAAGLPAGTTGVPAGGLTGEVLQKSSGVDGATTWGDVALTHVSGLGTGVATFLATPTSANLASAVTNETGTTSLVFSDTPTITTPNVTGTITETNNAAANTNANGLVLQNTGTATNGNQYRGPGLRQIGQAFASGAGNSQAVEFVQYVIGIQSAGSSPTGTWNLGSKIGAGAENIRVTITDAGAITAASFADTGGNTSVSVDISSRVITATNSFRLGASTTRDFNMGQDTSLSRSAAGIWQMGTNSSGSTNNALGSLLLANLTASGTLAVTGITTHGAQVRLKGYTVATLPAGTQGDTAFVTDSLAPTFLATVVGGGAIVTIVFYNGSNWVAQ